MADDRTQTPVPPPSIPSYATSPAPTPAAIATDDALPPATAETSVAAAIPTVVKQEKDDVDMPDAGTPAAAAGASAPPLPEQQQRQQTAEQSPAPAPAAAAAPPRTGTPLRATNGQEAGGSSSRAASQHPEPAGGSGAASFMPPAPAVHGAPVRQYLNQNVTGVLLEGMKQLARDQCVTFSSLPSSSGAGYADGHLRFRHL